MGFSHVQGKASAFVTSGTTVNVTLSSAPALGDLVVVAVYWDNSTAPAAAITVKDSANNAYTASPSSPFQITGAAGAEGFIYLFYLLSAPGSATAAITATFTIAATTIAIMRAEEFSYAGSVCTFDTDLGGNNGASTTAINSPSITPAGAGELLYAFSAPTSAITLANSPWTLDDAGIDSDGNAGEYILSSASGATAVNFTCTNSGGGEPFTLAAAFKLTAAPPSSYALDDYGLFMTPIYR